MYARQHSTQWRLKNAGSSSSDESSERLEKDHINRLHTVLSLSHGYRFELVNDVTLDELQKVLSDTGLRASFFSDCWLQHPKKVLTSSDEKIGKLVLREGTFSNIRIARQVYPDGTFGNFFVVRKLLSDEKIKNKTGARYDRQQALMWALEEMEILARLKQYQVAMTPLISAKMTNKKNQEQLYQFVELAGFGDLNEAITTLFPYHYDPIKLNHDKQLVLNYITQQLLRAVATIHECNVVHRDIKPSNVLLKSDMTVRLTDFASALDFNEDAGLRAEIPPSDTDYFAPIMLYRNLDIKMESIVRDQWALGLTILQLYHEKDYPFRRDEIQELHNFYKNDVVSGGREMAQKRAYFNQKISDMINHDAMLPEHIKQIVTSLMRITRKARKAMLLNNILERHKASLMTSDINLYNIDSIAKVARRDIEQSNKMILEWLSEPRDVREDESSASETRYATSFEQVKALCRRAKMPKAEDKNDSEDNNVFTIRRASRSIFSAPKRVAGGSKNSSRQGSHHSSHNTSPKKMSSSTDV